MPMTKEKPKEPGYYWLRSSVLFTDEKPRIIEIENDCVYYMGTDMYDGLDEVLAKDQTEWQGPIEPEES